MKPYFNVTSSNPVRDLQSIQALANRDAFRTWHAFTPIDPYRTGELRPTYYSAVHWPIEEGEVVRHVTLSMPGGYRIPRHGPWVTVAVGIRGAATFRVLGTEWDSRKHTLSEGTPFVLAREDAKIPLGYGVEVRIMRSDMPTTPLLGAVVETSIGYQGVA